MIKLDAPIIPYESMGGIKLYTHIKEVYEIIEQKGTEISLLGNFSIRYELNDSLDLWFNIINGKLYKITTLKNYTGKLFGKIGIGMPIKEVLKIEPSFVYDDFEEVYCSPKGIYIETDPVDDVVMRISVYIKELETDDFEKGNW